MIQKRLIEEIGNFRIVEIEDTDMNLEDLKCDSFNPEVNPDIPDLRQQEIEFEREVEAYGVFGYALEKWNPEIGHGWEHVDSCWGFIGQYDPEVERFNHYIVNELKSLVE